MLALGLLAFLAGCDTAGPGFRGIDGVSRSVEGSRFTLRFRGSMAEAVRVSPELVPRFDAVARRAALAAEAERPGCRVAWVQGDPAMMLMGLACDGAAAPAIPSRGRQLLCALEESWLEAGWLTGALTCRAV